LTILAPATVLVATALASAALGAWCMMREIRFASGWAPEESASAFATVAARENGRDASGEDGADNAPVCGVSISLASMVARMGLYFMVGAGFGVAAHALGADAVEVAQIIMIAVAVAVLAECDLRWFLLPDAATGWLALASAAPVVAALCATERLAGAIETTRVGAASEALFAILVGAAVAGGFLLLVRVAFSRLAGREALGLGDVKLAAALGAALGVDGVFMSIAVGAGATILLVVAQRWRAPGEAGHAAKVEEAPLGAGLALAGITVMFAQITGLR